MSRPIIRPLRGDISVPCRQGKNIFKQLVIVLFSSDADDIMEAKLDIFFSSLIDNSNAAISSSDKIYYPFIQICVACNFSAEDLMSYIVKIQKHGKCICGNAMDLLDYREWRVHKGCRFEWWLQYLQVSEEREGILYIKQGVNWFAVLHNQQRTRSPFAN